MNFRELVAHFLELRTPYFDPVLFTKIHGEHFGRVSFLGSKAGFWSYSGPALDFLALPRFGEPVAHFLELKRPYFDPVLFTKFHGEHFGRVSFLGPKTCFARIFWVLSRFSGPP